MQPAFSYSCQQIQYNNQHNMYKASPMPQQQPTPQILNIQQTPRQPAHPPPSKFVGSYVIDFGREVGHGNFSHVYNAIDQRQPNTKLAAKVVNVEILRSQNLQNLVKSEVEILLAMRHENILFCKDAIWDSTYCYIFTQFCEGGSLESKIRKAQGLTNKGSKSENLQPQMKLPIISQKQVLPLIKDIFQAMLYMERNHIIHRDIKAANIFIKENTAIVADFGFARYVHEPFYDLNIGSLPFMPPESISKNLYSNKTDVWAFGALLYQIFHGQSPYARSHDMKELIQKTYTPLHISAIRNDLSTEMKQFILNCLEVDMDKRKKFSEIEKMWYCRKLFQNIGQYNYGYRPDRPDRVTLPNTISINGKPINQRNLPANNNLLTVQDQLQRSGKITQAGNRPFGSRFKQKINYGNGSINMNYSVSKSKGKQKQKQQNYELIPDIKRQISNNPSPKLQQRDGKQTNLILNNNKIKTTNIPIFANDVSNLSPSPSIKINGKSESAKEVYDRNRIERQKEKWQKQGEERSSQREQLRTKQKQISKQKQIPKQQQIISFKDILLRIQQVRNYYKLAITLKDRSQRITEIKNRIFSKCVKQINRIGLLIQKDKIDLTVYDKNTSKQKSRELDQASQNNQIKNRKNKLSSIIFDYKTQFENQMKRRNIRIGSDGQDFSGGKNNSEFFSTQGSQVSTASLEAGSEVFVKNVDFKNKMPSLNQDLEYICQNQLVYSAGDSIKMSYEESQLYRTKLKQILDDIMNVEQGYALSRQTQKKQSERETTVQNPDIKTNLLKYRSTSPAAYSSKAHLTTYPTLQNPSFLTVPTLNSANYASNGKQNNLIDTVNLRYEDMEILSRLKWKQKSSC